MRNAGMRNAVQQSRAEILAELYETGVLIESEADEKIIRELTTTSEFGDELRALGDTDPDLLDN